MHPHVNSHSNECPDFFHIRSMPFIIILSACLFISLAVKENRLSLNNSWKKSISLFPYKSVVEPTLSKNLQ